MSPWEKLQKAVNESADAFVRDDVAMHRVRVATLAHARGSKTQRRAPWAWMLWSSLAIGAVAIAMMFIWPADRSARVSWHVLEAAAQVAARDPEVVHALRQDADVQFSEGSRVLLAKGGSATVSAHPSLVEVRLLNGKASARIFHRENAAWRVHAGPFEIQVTGTQFVTKWDEGARIFRLDLISGTVIVHGPHLNSSGQKVVTGQSVTVALGEGAVSWNSKAGADTPPAAEPRALIDLPAKPVGQATKPSTRSRPSQDAWQALVKAQRYSEAMNRVHEHGLEALISTGSLPDLLLLVDAARISRQHDVARLALLRLRKRFAAHEAATTSLFSLGQLAFDGVGAFDEAARYFLQYLEEAPNGALAREAAGRLVEALSRSGAATEAVAAARAYVERYPTGPHADLARRLLP